MDVDASEGETVCGCDVVVATGGAGAPITCTLTAADLPARIVEWQEFYRTSVTEVQQTTPIAVRLRLEGSDETLVVVASLAQREKECCAFFEFAIMLEPTARWLTISVPAGAEVVLADFTAMLRP